jgi:kynurenine formamidase
VLIDLTLAIDRKSADGQPLRNLGHLGTHFDIMDKEFPLHYVRRIGRLVDIRGVRDREIEVADLPSEIHSDEFVIFWTNYIEEIGYGGKTYDFTSAELSDALVAHLVTQPVSLIGVDAASIQRRDKHRQVDEYCAARNVFVVENLSNLECLSRAAGLEPFVVYCLPLNFRGLTGLPCRVVADVSRSSIGGHP